MSAETFCNEKSKTGVKLQNIATVMQKLGLKDGSKVAKISVPNISKSCGLKGVRYDQFKVHACRPERNTFRESLFLFMSL